MSSPLFADRPAPQPRAHDAVDDLIHRTRRLRGDVDAVRRDTVALDEDDPKLRWQRALCELAVRHLDNLGEHLGQLRSGPPRPAAGGASPGDGGPSGEEPAGSLLNRVGSAEWNLLTDEVSWSDELYEIFGRPPGSPPLALDDMPSVLLPEDQPLLTAMVTGCLVDGRPLDGEFRILRPDGRTRTLHMSGEPVLDAGGSTAAMWAVLRDVSDLRRGEQAVRRSGASLRREEAAERTEHRTAAELRRTVLPPWRGPRRIPARGPGALDVAGHHLPSAPDAPVGGDWYDALELPGGRALLTVGDLTGHGVPAASTMATLLGAVRGMAVAGVEPGVLLGHLDRLLETSAQPTLGSALCCHYDPEDAVLSWARAGHPAPLLFRDGSGRPLPPPDGVLLGAASRTGFEQDEVRLFPGDVLVLHTDGLNGCGGPDALLALAPLFARARTAQECVRYVVEEFGEAGRRDGVGVLIARVGA